MELKLDEILNKQEELNKQFAEVTRKIDEMLVLRNELRGKFLAYEELKQKETKK